MKKRQEKTGNGFPLGYLVYNQKRNINSLSLVKIDRLNKLNFVWNPNEEDWEERCEHLTYLICIKEFWASIKVQDLIQMQGLVELDEWPMSSFF